MTENLVQRYVLFDVYGWSTTIPGSVDRRDYHVARKGELIEVSAEEAARGEALGALSAQADDVEAAVAASTEPPSWSDEQLDSANVEDTVAYLVQHPSESRRVADAEETRSDRKLKVRKGVLEAAERIGAAYDDQVAADAEAREAAEAEEQRAYENTQGTSSTAPKIPA